MSRLELIQKITHHLQQGDHDWFDVEAMRHGRSAEWHQLIGKAIESCAMNIEGATKQYIPLYLPVIVHAATGAPLSIDPQLIGDLLSPHVPAGYSLVVFPNLKSLSATIELDPVTAYGLSKEMAVSIYEQDGLEGVLPFDEDDDVYTVHDTIVMEGMLLACLVYDGLKEVPLFSFPSSALADIADRLAHHFVIRQGEKPVVHIGTVSTRSTLSENTLLMKAFCHLKLLASKGYRQVELDFTHADPSGLNLNYVVRDGGKAIAEVKLPEGRLSDFVRHCEHLERYANLRCAFLKHRLS